MLPGVGSSWARGFACGYRIRTREWPASKAINLAAELSDAAGGARFLNAYNALRWPG